ncbi:probable serine/threonine-protein kinase At1g01540 [Amaranthus tricolor]|uniref:probable serine/threonine-protein kinase At1g01540 n=1 Tax=Amaranthus tricolor TaxID=29722 RepID=UPI002583B39C|nr:probable serine/threonine-protein kinase At1g01540 [Amaranthus tricolor]
MEDQLSKSTSIFGIRLWVLIGIAVGVAFVFFLFLISLCYISKRNSSKSKRKTQFQSQAASTNTAIIPVLSKEIQEITVANSSQNTHFHHHEPQQPDLVNGPGRIVGNENNKLKAGSGEERLQIELVGKDKFGGSGSGSSSSAARNLGDHQVPLVVPEVSHLGWGRWYTLRELEDATNGFSDQNVIGEGGYGIVYYGVLDDNTQIAVKNLLNNKGQAEKEFKVEVEAIGRVRHKCLVKLLGYCAEGAQRMLVYEYVNNGNLEQWLHGDVGPISPLTWEIRMNIILCTAKGLTYLHEGLEPKVVHRDIKSSNILLDKQWNAKVSDFGLAKLLVSEHSYVSTRVMGTFGYVAPEYASTGMLNERNDVYSFGILIMEILSGRVPVDYSRPAAEVNLVDWLKMMVTNRNPEGILDPKLPEKPASRALKKTLLVALRCVDPNAQKRPKMGQVVHMLEAEQDSSFRDDRTRTSSRTNVETQKEITALKQVIE